MKQRLILFFVICFTLSFFTGCDKLDFLNPKKTGSLETGISRPVVRGTVIAKVNNLPITQEELDQDVASYNAMVPADKPEEKITTREQKINYLKNELVRRMLLYQEAETRGLGRKPEAIEALEKTKQDLLVVQLIREEAEKIEASSAEIEDYYNTYKEQLKEPEERQIREIVVSSEQDAKDVLIQLLQGTDFATLAKDRSIAPSKKDGGDLGFINRGKKSAQFDAVAFSDTLEAGRISNIFKGPDGYYVLKLEAKRGGKQRSLSEMYDDIKRGLVFLKHQQKIEDLVGKLSREAKLEFYEGQIK
jgi:peptidyl-prolyl cis-trans isomerase C